MTSAMPVHFQPRKGLLWLSGVIGGGVGVSAVYATTGLGTPCPFRTVTGWNCPFCGGTRMGASLLQLDIGAAFAYNPLAFIALAIATLIGLAWAVEFAGGPSIRPPAAVRARISRARAWQWLTAGAAVLVAWTLLRNLL